MSASNTTEFLPEPTAHQHVNATVVLTENQIDVMSPNDVNVG